MKHIIISHNPCTCDFTAYDPALTVRWKTQKEGDEAWVTTRFRCQAEHDMFMKGAALHGIIVESFPEPTTPQATS